MSRGGQFRHRVACVAVLVVGASAFLGVSAVSAAGGPPNVLFKKGYNLCRAASLGAVRKAGGQPYRAGLFANQVCTWERADLQAGLTLSTHPAEVGTQLMRTFLAQNGKNGIKAKRIAVPGASKAVLVTLPSQSQQAVKYLFAAYGTGTLQINVSAPGPLSQARLVKVMRLFARR